MRENCIRKVTLTFQSTQTWDCRVPGPSGESMQSPANTEIALALLKVKSARILFQPQTAGYLFPAWQLLWQTPLIDSESISPPAILWQRAADIKGVFSQTFFLMTQLWDCSLGAFSGLAITVFHSSCLISGSASSIHKYIKLHKNQNFYLHRGVWRVRFSCSVGQEKSLFPLLI